MTDNQNESSKIVTDENWKEQAQREKEKLGAPDGSAPEINLDLAKHHIDLMEVLEEKTKGNLTNDESKKLSLALHEARMQYVQAAGG